MWQREEEIFGSTEFPSPLEVRIVKQPSVQLVDPSYGDRFGPIAYALFSAIENKQSVVKEGIVFCVRMSWEKEEGLKARRRAQNEQRRRNRRPTLPESVEDISDDVGAALKAWCSFGGLGARTRRGCGAVFCNELTSSVPDLPGEVITGGPESNAMDAWKAAVQIYRDFRQSPRGRRHPKTLRSGRTVNVPGRSHWPEADSIRKITGSSLKPSRQSSTNVPRDEDPNDHSAPVVPPETLPAFPRAALGLPINFHFADGPGRSRPGIPNADPQDVQLVPIGPDGADGDRMSSPIITRPLWRGGKWYPCIVILDQRVSDLHVRLVGKCARSDGEDLSYDLLPKHIADRSLGVLRPMGGRASALDAFRDFVQRRGFHEMTR
jgi:CRISPR-associated protein Cmr1